MKRSIGEDLDDVANGLVVDVREARRILRSARATVEAMAAQYYGFKERVEQAERLFVYGVEEQATDDA